VCHSEVGGIVRNRVTKGTGEDFVGFNIKNFPCKGVSGVFGDADDVTDAMFSIKAAVFWVGTLGDMKYYVYVRRSLQL